MKEIVLNTKTKIIKNTKIDTVDFVLLFPNDYVKDDIFVLEIIESFLSIKSKRYQSEKEFFNALRSKMIINRKVSHLRIGNKLFVKFELVVPRENLISDYSLEEAFEFFVDSIYNPFADNQVFDEETYEIEKKYHITKELDDNKGLNTLAFNKFASFIDPSEKFFTSPDKILEIYQNSTPESAYKLYKKYVLDNDFISYVYGDIDEKTVEYLFKKYLPYENKTLKYNISHQYFLDDKKYDYLEDTSSFNQSVLFMGYTVDDFKSEDTEYLSLVGNILGASENDLIFKSLRIDNSLVYTCSVIKYNLNGFFYIKAYLQQKNKELAINLVKETFEKLKNKEFLEECIKKLIRGMEVEILRNEDSKYYVFDEIIDNDFKVRTIKSILDSYKNMKIEDVLDFIERIYLKKVFFIRGEKDEEN